MTAEQVRVARAEAEEKLRTTLKTYEEALGEHRDFIRELRDNCPHERKAEESAQYIHEVVCEDCGAILAL